MLRVAICDDFEEDRSIISNWVTEYFDSNNVACKTYFFETCEDIVAEYQEFNPSFDIVFLDVYTNQMTGFEAAQIIKSIDKNVPIVFATNSVEDAVNGYDVGASGYLVKPINKSKLISILDRLNLVGTNDKEILLKIKNRYRNFKFDEINYLESDRNVVKIHTTDKQCFIVYSKLSDLEDQLNDSRFLRCHQSYLVNMNFVSEVDSSFKMKNGALVPIRIRGRKEIVEKYYFYFFEKGLETI